MTERIIKKIKEKGLSCSAVEKQLGFGNGAIKRFETSSPSIEKIKLLSDFLNVSIEWLVFGTEQGNNNLTKNEKEILRILNRLHSETDQSKLLGYAECYVDAILHNPSADKGADAQQRLDKTS